MLVAEAGSDFHAELGESAVSGLVVRLAPAEAGSTGWVFELLALVERWLQACRLPAADVRYAGRSYLIQAPAAERDWRGVVDPVSAG